MRRVTRRSALLSNSSQFVDQLVAIMVIYENIQPNYSMDFQSIYVSTSQIRNRKRFGICDYPESHLKFVSLTCDCTSSELINHMFVSFSFS